MTTIDPNECPCTTGHNSFDGMTLSELGAIQREQLEMLRSNDEDGHLESDAWHDRHDPIGCPQCEFEANETPRGLIRTRPHPDAWREGDDFYESSGRYESPGKWTIDPSLVRSPDPRSTSDDDGHLEVDAFYADHCPKVGPDGNEDRCPSCTCGRYPHG